MRIFYLSQSYFPSTEANSVQVLKMCDAFANQGKEITLFGMGKPENLEKCFRDYGINSRFTVHLSNIPHITGNTILLAITSFLKILFTRRPDLMYGRAILSLALASLLKYPFVYECHSPPRTSLHQLIEKWLVNRPNNVKLVCISNELRKWYLSNIPCLDEKKVLVAADAADSSNNSIKCNSDNPKGKAIKIGYIGSFYPGKGADFVCKLALQMANYEFHLVGGPIDLLPRYILDNMPSNLKILGVLPHRSALEYLLKLDILLAPYMQTVQPAAGKMNIAQWMSPLKIFEYMSSGKAIVSSDLPVLREVLKSESNCLLCPPDNLEAWKEAILTLIHNPKLRIELGSQALQEFKRFYTWDSRAKNILEAL